MNTNNSIHTIHVNFIDDLPKSKWLVGSGGGVDQHSREERDREC